MKENEWRQYVEIMEKERKAQFLREKERGDYRGRGVRWEYVLL